MGLSALLPHWQETGTGVRTSAWSLGGKGSKVARAPYRGAGLGHQAPWPTQPWLVTWLKQVQASKCGQLKMGRTTGHVPLPTLWGSSDDLDQVN